ncbi:MAG: hypothetical protein IPK07_25180 [Deltaproteobacteria bacterium]|nr:hypothetical protein [Deltaproteobacteria bacterium]
MADTPPLLVNGFVKSKLVPFRFEKDASATPEAFKARARFFDLLELERLKKLDEPSLVSSLHGEIARVLFTIPYWVFFPESFPGEAALIQSIRPVVPWGRCEGAAARVIRGGQVRRL